MWPRIEQVARQLDVGGVDVGTLRALAVRFGETVLVNRLDELERAS
ncbi:hypothetical protein [Saccharothrix sp. NRRL B-16314]|nr:hypothetical protein [Saccharothrix sp. NRRL B-16314]